MKLIDYLKTLDNKEIVAIGPAHGTSYFYIGEAGDTETVRNLFYDMVNLSRLRANKYEHRIKVSRIRSDMELERDTDRMNAHIEYIQTAVPFLEREVIRTFHKEIDDCTAILIEGNETGQWWFKSEFDKANKFAKFTRNIMREG